MTEAHPPETVAPRWLSEAEMAAWLGLVELFTRLPASLDRQLREDAGIPHAHYQILAVLSAAQDRALRMSELARTTSTSTSRLSHAVAALEVRGWVRRRPCPDDGRGQLAELTDAGTAVLQATAPGHVAHVRSLVFDRLSPSEVDQLAALTARLLAAPEKDGGRPGQRAT
jgi:DNA-binding MarR family transcriptional regulator